MKFKDYVVQLNALLETNPEAGEFIVVASDDEGNSYNQVYCAPCIGYFDDGTYSYDFDDLVDRGIIKGANSVCLN